MLRLLSRSLRAANKEHTAEDQTTQKMKPLGQKLHSLGEVVAVPSVLNNIVAAGGVDSAVGPLNDSSTGEIHEVLEDHSEDPRVGGLPLFLHVRVDLFYRTQIQPNFSRLRTRGMHRSKYELTAPGWTDRMYTLSLFGLMTLST